MKLNAISDRGLNCRQFWPPDVGSASSYSGIGSLNPMEITTTSELTWMRISSSMVSCVILYFVCNDLIPTLVSINSDVVNNGSYLLDKICGM